MIRFSVTYEVWTYADIVAGETDQRGTIGDGLTLREAVEEVQATRTEHVDSAEGVQWDGDLFPTRVRRVTVNNPAEWLSGETETRSLHIPESVSLSSSRRIARLCGVKL